MDIQTLNPAALRKLGIEALTKALGPVGMVRFLQQFETGVGDYTKEREQWLKESDIKSIADQIKNRRKKK
ncbi:MAG: hypothetical protein KG012_12210 [Deltaproteobacteria bacterium]|jgi:hypothetical protein|nr:hypothetical protein [Deltaproteobacteria bacterium]